MRLEFFFRWFSSRPTEAAKAADPGRESAEAVSAVSPEVRQRVGGAHEPRRRTGLGWSTRRIIQCI